MKKEKFVVDTCILIHLYMDLERPDLLPRLYPGRLFVVSEVVREYSLQAKFRKQENHLASQINQGEIKLSDPDIYKPEAESFISKFSASLGKGELFSAALAKEKGLTLISDDVSALNELLFKGAGIKRKTTRDVLSDAKKNRLLVQKDYDRLLKKIDRALKRRRPILRRTKKRG